MTTIDKTSDSGSSISISSLADFGGDLDSVSAHKGAPLAIGKKISLGAYSYATGNDVHISSSKTDKGLIAHELTHVVQQNAGK